MIEETNLGDGQLKELLLSLHWVAPLHIVLVVDERYEEERIITVYLPTADRWSDNYRRRRR